MNDIPVLMVQRDIEGCPQTFRLSTDNYAEFRGLICLKRQDTRHLIVDTRQNDGVPLIYDFEVKVEEAISAAEALLPGREAPEGETDPRWQAIIAVAEFIPIDPEEVWLFARKWGAHPDDDLRMAIATCVLEHLLEHHFDAFIARVEEAAHANQLFAATVTYCGRFGQSAEPGRSARLDRLKIR